MPARILVVDDEPAILTSIKRYLSSHSFDVAATNNGSEALLLVQEWHPDLVLTDAEMPGLDGHTLCRVLRKEGAARAIPIIIMSGSRIAEKDVLDGLQGGADDYITKPFSMAVLAARIQTVLRRYQVSSQPGDALRRFGIELDPAGRTVKVKGRTVSLTRKEFDLLAVLMKKAGRVLSINFLLETVWGYDPADYNDPGTVEVHISHLRKKLGPKIAARIANVTGHGYKLET